MMIFNHLIILALGCIPLLSMAYDVDVEQAERDQAFALGVQAYIWAYPLVVSAATAEAVTHTDKPLPNAHAPFNSLGHVAKLFTAADKDVVSSNVDTVYSSAFLDLKQGAALISVPASGERYYSLMLEDAYTNVFGYIGSRATGNKAGDYMIVGPGWDGKTPPGANVIESPTSLVWVIGRTMVDGQEDLPNVAAFQQQLNLVMVPPAVDSTPIKQRWNLTTKPGLVPVKQVEALDWESYYYWTGQLMKDNPPPVADSALYSQFEAIGISSENGFQSGALSEATKNGLAEGFAAGNRIVKRDTLKSGGTEINGWAYNLGAGQWGQNYNLRAAIAMRSLGQNIAAEALYMNTREDARQQTLNGSKDYTLTFSKDQLPPVNAFWSITMYNAENFFVDNHIDRYAISNRNEGLKTNPDGSLTIYIQQADPGTDKTSNWLPAPADNFRLSMRLYVPKQIILEGKWQPPALEEQP
jgi:hypothetical protein